MTDEELIKKKFDDDGSVVKITPGGIALDGTPCYIVVFSDGSEVEVGIVNGTAIRCPT